VVLGYDTVLSDRVFPEFLMELLIPSSRYSTSTVKNKSVVTVLFK
jgi:hypothetical protein